MPRQSTISWKWIGLAVIGLAIALMLDMPARALVTGNLARFEKRDIVQCLRSGGYLPLWWLVAAAIVLVDIRNAGGWSRSAARRGLAIGAAPAFAGAIAEVLKLLARRERIDLSASFYTYRPFLDRPFNGSGLSMPSSHAIVAFAAAFAISREFLAARPVVFAFAIGTAATRLLAGAHFVSDVYVSFVLAWCAAALVAKAAKRFALVSHLEGASRCCDTEGTAEASRSDALPAAAATSSRA